MDANKKVQWAYRFLKVFYFYLQYLIVIKKLLKGDFNAIKYSAGFLGCKLSLIYN